MSSMYFPGPSLDGEVNFETLPTFVVDGNSSYSRWVVAFQCFGEYR